MHNRIRNYFNVPLDVELEFLQLKGNNNRSKENCNNNTIHDPPTPAKK